MYYIPAIRQLILSIFFLSLTACGGGGGSSPSTQATYYVDSTEGNDNNSGTDSSTPWQTLEKLNSTTFSPGTIIRLKRGETWYEQLTISDSDITIDAYGTGDLPVIDGSIEVSGWTDLGGNIYSKTVTILSGEEGLGNISENGSLLTFREWFISDSDTLSAAPTGSFTYDFFNDTIYIKTGSDPSLNTYRASRKYYGINTEDTSNISVKNVQVQRFSLNGIDFADCDNCKARSVVSKDGGGTVIAVFNPYSGYLYAGNGIEYNNSCTNGFVEDVAVSNIFDSCISPQTFVSNQKASGFIFKNSTLDKCGFAGIEVSVLSNGGTTGSTLDNVSISGMTITNSGKGWSGRRYGTEGHGIRVRADTGAGTMSGVSISRSTIESSAGDGIYIGGASDIVTLDRLLINNNDIYGIEVIEPEATTLRVDMSSSLIHDNVNYGFTYNVPNGAGFNIYQNSFYNNGAINFAVFGQSGIADMRNNIFHSSSAMTHIFVNVILTEGTIDFNCYEDGLNMIGYDGSAYSTLADFNSATSYEASGDGSGFISFSSAGTGNFTLQADSSCKTLGSTSTGISEDYTGNTFAMPPSSGAYQF